MKQGKKFSLNCHSVGYFLKWSTCFINESFYCVCWWCKEMLITVVSNHQFFHIQFVVRLSYENDRILYTHIHFHWHFDYYHTDSFFFQNDHNFISHKCMNRSFSEKTSSFFHCENKRDFKMDLKNLKVWNVAHNNTLSAIYRFNSLWRQNSFHFHKKMRECIMFRVCHWP